jgi:hypothetical protein
MRASTAYFIGAGSIVAAIAIGLGGGLVAGNIMNPVTPKQGPDSGKMERRAEPVAAMTTPSERVQYLAGSQAFGAVIAPPAQAEVQSTAATAEPPSPPPAQTAAANQSRPANAPASPSTKPAEQQASSEATSSPENAYATAKDADVKRATSERRRAERRQHWAERHRYEMRDPRETRDRTDWGDVARSVREDSDAREFIASPRHNFSQSHGFPQIRLFGPDDD